MYAEWDERYRGLLGSVKTPGYKAAKRRALASGRRPTDWRWQIKRAQLLHRPRPPAASVQVEKLTAQVQRLQAAINAQEQMYQEVLARNAYLRRQLRAGPGSAVDMAPWSELESPIHI